MSAIVKRAAFVLVGITERDGRARRKAVVLQGLHISPGVCSSGW